MCRKYRYFTTILWMVAVPFLGPCRRLSLHAGRTYAKVMVQKINLTLSSSIPKFFLPACFSASPPIQPAGPPVCQLACMLACRPACLHGACMRASMHARACVHVCVCAWVRAGGWACVRACVRACGWACGECREPWRESEPVVAV
jgi:hypothetical protein